MTASRRVRLWALLGALSIGTLFQVGVNGCYEYYAVDALTSLDFCAVLNCSGGSFFNFCSPVPLLMDCPNLAQQTGP
jgi:hypothetical protein